MSFSSLEEILWLREVISAGKGKVTNYDVCHGALFRKYIATVQVSEDCTNVLEGSSYFTSLIFVANNGGYFVFWMSFNEMVCYGATNKSSDSSSKHSLTNVILSVGTSRCLNVQLRLRLT